MSKYATNRMLWEVASNGDLAQQLTGEPQDALTGRDLDDRERTALAKADIRELFLLGVHPFLLYNFALRLNGGFSMPFMQAYLEQLKGLDLGDLET